METVTNFVRRGEGRTPSIFVRAPKPKGRPRTEYRARVTKPQDVEEARKLGYPLYLLEPEAVTALGYPMDFPPELIVDRSILPAVDTTYRTIPFDSPEAVLKPRIEDVAIALLSIDAIAARAVLDRNRDAINSDYLLKRIIQENAEERATWVRLFDLVPGLPRVGETIPKAALERKLRQNPVLRRLPL